MAEIKLVGKLIATPRSQTSIYRLKSPSVVDEVD
jgi:hypothetical protein